MNEYYIGQIFDEMYPPEAASWCDSNGAIIVELQPVGNVRVFQIQEVPEHIPTYEEQKEARAMAYQREVDPITSHIQRLRDLEQTQEIIAEINELILEREVKVNEIREMYPYPEQ